VRSGFGRQPCVTCRRPITHKGRDAFFRRIVGEVEQLIAGRLASHAHLLIPTSGEIDMLEVETIGDLAPLICAKAA
jgi:hypothetical protein